MAKKKSTPKKARKKANKKRTARRSTANPSRTCAMMQHHKHLAEIDEAYQRNRRDVETFSARARLTFAPARTTILRIPVVVHVIHHTVEENISLSQIESQIDALNRDFRLRNEDRSDVPQPFQDFVADTLIEFGLAVRDPQGNATTGITRTKTSLEEFPYDPQDPSAITKLNNLVKRGEFGKTPWPRDDYLNMWVCTIEGGLLGYAAFPGEAASTDGVVINNNAFGSTGTAQAPFNMGRTAVHEVGHWLNLLHIWGDDDFFGSPNLCAGSDNVSDTPNQSGSNGGDLTKDSFPHISCDNGPNGDMFMNYMDYVDDAVMVMFTKGQVARMNDTLSGPRASLANSKGLTPVATERLALGERTESLSEAYPSEAERGSRTTLVFDGVSWISAD